VTYEDFIAMSAPSRIEAQSEIVRSLAPGTRVRVVPDRRLVKATMHRFDGCVGVVATPGHREPGSGIVVPEPGMQAYVDFGGDLGIRVLHPLALERV
jgi:hypothetical protein